MQKRGQGIDSPWQETLLDAFGKKRTDARSLVGTISRLSDLEISSCPLLKQRRKQCAGEADYQAHEPKCIHPNCVVWWREGGWGKRKGSRNGGAIGVDRCLINIREVEVGGVLWTLLNILNGH